MWKRRIFLKSIIHPFSGHLIHLYILQYFFTDSNWNIITIEWHCKAISNNYNPQLWHLRNILIFYHELIYCIHWVSSLRDHSSHINSCIEETACHHKPLSEMNDDITAVACILIGKGSLRHERRFGEYSMAHPYHGQTHTWDPQFFWYVAAVWAQQDLSISYTGYCRIICLIGIDMESLFLRKEILPIRDIWSVIQIFNAKFNC